MTDAVYLGLGSNLGDREGNLQRALELLEDSRLHVLKRSSVYETEPQDVQEQGWFLNMVVQCETTHFPRTLLRILQNVERTLGREREGVVPRGPRSIDLDILLYGQQMIRAEELTIPHPRMSVRRFVLEPLYEIAPKLRLPGSGEPVAQLLAKINGQVVRKLDNSQAPTRSRT